VVQPQATAQTFKDYELESVKTGKVMAMAYQNRVQVKICGMEFHLTCEEDPEYVIELAEALDKKLNELTSSNKVTLIQAAIFTALDYADAARKAEESADNLRDLLKGYLEDANKARAAADEARKELERLKKELAQKATN